VPRLTQPSTLRGTVKWVSAFELSNNKMVMMYVGHIAAYRRTCSPGRLVWSEGRRPSGAGLRTSDESGELSKWLSHDDSTINIVIRIIIIIILLLLSYIALFGFVICTCAEYATWRILSYQYPASQPKIFMFAPYNIVWTLGLLSSLTSHFVSRAYHTMILSLSY